MEGEDVVLWYIDTHHHEENMRDEDRDTVPALWVGFRLEPQNFWDRTRSTSTLDLPRPVRRLLDHVMSNGGRAGLCSPACSLAGRGGERRRPAPR